MYLNLGHTCVTLRMIQCFLYVYALYPGWCTKFYFSVVHGCTKDVLIMIMDYIIYIIGERVFFIVAMRIYYVPWDIGSCM